jgi:hypothetical protein
MCQTFALDRRSLIVAVARLLGYNRTGDHIEVAIDNAIGQLVANGALLDLAGQLRLTDDGRESCD